MTRGGYSGGYTPVDTLRSSSLLKMSHQNHGQNGGNYNYEYYDNTTTTSAHLLASGEGLYGTGKMKSRNFQAANMKKTANMSANAYDPYNYELQRGEDDYDDEKIVDHDEAGHAVDEYEENYQEEETESMSSSRSEKNTNSTSGNEESSGAANEVITPTYAPTPVAPTAKVSTASNAAAIFNNNVSGSIGSGVESIKKHTYGLTNGKFRKQ